MGERPDIGMVDHEICALLAEPGHTMTVATVLPNGQPHLTAVWYGFTEDGTIGFTTYPASQKAVNLARDPRITVLVECGDGHASLRGVQIAGQGELDATMSRKLELSKSVSARYPGRTRSVDPERAMDRRIAVLIHPKDVSSWDHRKLAGQRSPL